MAWDINPLYFLAEILFTFNKRSLSKYKFDKISREQSKSEILHFDGSFCPNYIKFQLQKYRRIISHDTEEWCKFKEKLTCGFKYDMRNLVNFQMAPFDEST